MLTISYVGTSVGLETISTSVLTHTWTLQFRYNGICTNFNHDGTSGTFTGRARLTGEAWKVDNLNSSVSSMIGAAPSLVMTVYETSYIPSFSVGSWGMTVTNVANPFSSSYTGATTTFAAIDAEVHCRPVSFVASGSVQGDITGDFNVHLGESLGDSGNDTGFQMSRGGSCPV